MPPRLPQASGKDVLRLLRRLGYEVLRQRGSHARLKKDLPSGPHLITIPLHSELAKGTLHDILSSVANRNNVPLKELTRQL